ncbi:hypothetical protein [Prevotella histicola]|uniref:Uncharacterized protein n=1 Tax=Prevotella histicola JCM 15637 = DNF00424 TaxID=1236504 RepID=A0AAW3FBX2_9BACT|nr:hypothetical protein [Prevotella histicola]KGF24815.1 hypothetical protein HMPREF2132_10975 [Prevotella histicola JCM 15637 = DNF00424]
MKQIELCTNTENVLTLKRQIEEVFKNIVEFVDKNCVNAEAINDRLMGSLSVANEILDKELIASINEEFVRSKFERI